MFKPLTQLNYFFRLATERKLSGSDQLMYLHIFNKFNQAHWTETLRIKDAELKDLMRLYDTNGKPASIDVIRRGRQRLKAKGFIEFKSGDGQEPEYWLPCLHPADTPANTPADTPADTLANSNIRTREDVKTFETLDILSSSSNARANSQELDDILEYWEQVRGARLSFEHIAEIGNMVAKYGFDFVEATITEASDANGNHFGLSMKFFRSVLASKLNRAKGAKKIDRKHDANWLNYTEPDTDWISDAN